MTTARFAAFHEEAGRPVDAVHGAVHLPASIADLRFTLRVTLAAALVKLSLVGYALLGGGSAIGIG